MDTDSFLIQKMKKGNEDALERFVRKYYPVILKYCSYHTQFKHDAEDLTQETFVRFFSSLPRYQHRGKIVNYLYVIAGNLCRDDKRRCHELLVEQLPETGVKPMDSIEDRLAIEQALTILPEELREVIILHYFQNLKLKEVSEILQISQPLVKYRLKRAKEFMKENLREEERI